MNLEGFEAFLALQQARILWRFAVRDAERREDQWTEGKWTGCETLELKESRK